MVWNLTHIYLSFSPAAAFWVPFLSALCRGLLAVLPKGKLWRSGVLCRAVKCFYQLLLARRAVAAACLREYLLPGSTSLPGPFLSILSSLSVSWDASSSLLPGHTAARQGAALGSLCAVKSAAFLPHPSLPLHHDPCANQAKPHLSGPGDHVRSEISLRHTPSLSAAETPRSFSDVSYPAALQHLLALYSHGVEVVLAVVLCGCSGHLELLKRSCYFPG